MDPLIHLKFSKLVATSGMLHINVQIYVMLWRFAFSECLLVTVSNKMSEGYY